MGNIHAFNHRVTALSMAFMASAGFICFVLAGLSCEYLELTAEPDRSVMTPGGTEFVGEDFAYLGVQCPAQEDAASSNSFYSDEDRMWVLSRIFWYTSLGLSGLTALLAWSLAMCIPPRAGSWRTLSIVAACAAVLGVPIFLIFESTPCTMDINRQTCSLGMGGYFNIAAVGLFILMTLLTQCLSPPNWSRDEAKAAWTNDATGHRKINVNEITIPGGSNEEFGGTEGTSSPRNGSPNPNRNPEDFPAMRDFDNASEVSSISGVDEPLPRMRDVELGPPPSNPVQERQQQPVPSPLHEDVDRTQPMMDEPTDKDIRRGATKVITALKEKRDSTLRRFRESRQSRSSAGASTPSQSEHEDEVAERDQQQQGSSSRQEEGLNPAAICPDGSSDAYSSFLPTCVDGQQLLEDTAELVRTASKLATTTTRRVTTVEEHKKEKKLDVIITHTMEEPKPLDRHRRQQSLSQSVRTPITAVTILPTSGQYGFDGVSEMTPAVSHAHPEDTIAILQDLAREY